MHNPTNHLILSSTSIEGTNVRNLADEKLGDIKDIMLDVDSGRIVYAVIAVSEGFLGLDSKYFAIPWQALRFDTDREIALLDVSKERLKDAPGFDKDNWPATPQREFVDEVHSFYGYEPFYNRGQEEGAFEKSTSDANINRGTTTVGQSSFDRNADAPDLNRNTGDAFSTGANDPNRGTATGSTSYDRDADDPNLNRDRGDDERRMM